MTRAKLATALGITAAALTLAACGSGGTTTDSTPKDQPAATATNGKPLDKGWVLESAKITADGLGSFGGTVRVTNTNDKPSTAAMTVTLMQGGGQVASLQGAADQVQPGKTVTVQMVSTDPFVKGPWVQEFQVDASY